MLHYLLLWKCERIYFYQLRFVLQSHVVGFDSSSGFIVLKWIKLDSGSFWFITLLWPQEALITAWIKLKSLIMTSGTMLLLQRSPPSKWPCFSRGINVRRNKSLSKIFVLPLVSSSSAAGAVVPKIREMRLCNKQVVRCYASSNKNWPFWATKLIGSSVLLSVSLSVYTH